MSLFSEVCLSDFRMYLFSGPGREVFPERVESLLTEGHMIFSQEIIGSVLWSSLKRPESLFSEGQNVFSKEAIVFSESL